MGRGHDLEIELADLDSREPKRLASVISEVNGQSERNST